MWSNRVSSNQGVIPMDVSYIAWLIMAVKVGIVSTAECVFLNLIFDKKAFMSVAEKISGRKSLGL